MKGEPCKKNSEDEFENLVNNKVGKREETIVLNGRMADLFEVHSLEH